MPNFNVFHKLEDFPKVLFKLKELGEFYFNVLKTVRLFPFLQV